MNNSISFIVYTNSSIPCRLTVFQPNNIFLLPVISLRDTILSFIYNSVLIIATSGAYQNAIFSF